MSDRVIIPLDPLTDAVFCDPREAGVKPAWCFDEEGLIYLRCKCGVILGTLTRHSIDADGTVNASVLHDPKDTRWREVVGACNWHVFIRLQDWAFGAMPHDSEKILPKNAFGLAAPQPSEREEST